MLKFYLKISAYILTSLLGVFLFIFGGYDDSPGAQLLGLSVFIFGVFKLIRQWRSVGK